MKEIDVLINDPIDVVHRKMDARMDAYLMGKEEKMNFIYFDDEVKPDFIVDCEG